MKDEPDALTSETPLSERDGLLFWRAFGRMPYAGAMRGPLNRSRIQTIGDVLTLLDELAGRLREHVTDDQAREEELAEMQVFRAQVRKLLAPLAQPEHQP